MNIAELTHTKRPEQPTPERDDTAEWVSVAWVDDANGTPRILFWFDHETDGFAEFEPEGRLLIAPIGKPSFQERQAKQLAPLAVRFGGQANVPEDARTYANISALAREILLDWDGVEDADGAPLPYTPEAGIAALADYRLRDAVVTAASTLEINRQQSIDADAETLGNVSNGASPTGAGSKNQRAKRRSKAS